MKIKVSMDESYRIFIREDDALFLTEMDVTEELIIRFNNAEKEFKEVEEKLYKLYQTTIERKNEINAPTG